MNEITTLEAKPIKVSKTPSLKDGFSENMETLLIILALIILLVLIMKHSKRSQGSLLGLGEVLPMIEG